MLSLPIRAALPAALVTVVSLLAAREARAESAPAPPQCRVQVIPQGTNVPANLPALVVDDFGSSPGLTANVEITNVSGATTAVTFDKIADPRDPKVTLFVNPKKEPLEVDATHTVAYSKKCSSGRYGDTSGITMFTVGPAVALPKTIGAAATQYADGLVTIAPSDELKAFLRTTRFEVSVDGVSLGTTRYGAETGEIDVQLSTVGVAVAGVYTSASTNVCKTSAIEKHEVRLSAHVAGAETDPEPLTFSVDIDCAKRVNVSSSLPDGGGDDRGASFEDDQVGCSVGGPGSAGSLASFFLAGAGVAVLCRRRRK